ncbi:hypothetical protein FOYG_17369 [Fusarium oxysporum NRRL 32931]|uniref:Uncharacterized protein n=1 Tax=Fusarium oxysporum NRRL 32931 TaxID=660029 RepID=W9HEN5_FUSOX|nr:hypothetical protein FOYG_17369 [Fusarium oxysporum NRRL 32931]
MLLVVPAQLAPEKMNQHRVNHANRSRPMISRM